MLGAWTRLPSHINIDAVYRRQKFGERWSNEQGLVAAGRDPRIFGHRMHWQHHKALELEQELCAQHDMLP